MIFNQQTDATALYRETSALKTVRMDNTADTGSLMEIIRDTVVVLGQGPTPAASAGVPQGPEGTRSAVAR